MSDEKEDSKKDEGKETKKKKSKLILIIIPLVVILLGGGGFFAYKTFLAPSGGADEQVSSEEGGHGKHGEKKHARKSKHGGHGDSGEHASGGGPTFFNLSPFVVNLQDNIGTRYLKLTLKLELTDPEAESELKAQLPRIRDALIILLSSKNYSEIGSVEGKYRLRDEIVKRINRLLTEASVRGAYFTDFVIQ